MRTLAGVTITTTSSASTPALAANFAAPPPARCSCCRQEPYGEVSETDHEKLKEELENFQWTECRRLAVVRGLCLG